MALCVCASSPLLKEMSQSHCHMVEAGWHLNIWKYPICKRPQDLRYAQAAEPWCWIKNAKDTIWPLSYLQDFRKTPTIFKVKLPNTCIIKSQRNMLASVRVYRVQRWYLPVEQQSLSVFCSQSDDCSRRPVGNNRLGKAKSPCSWWTFTHSFNRHSAALQDLLLSTVTHITALCMTTFATPPKTLHTPRFPLPISHEQGTLIK